jgi:RNA polymerase sigma-70 factor, ECF subfamily
VRPIRSAHRRGGERPIPHSDDHPDVLLVRARAGDQAARGRLFELYRNYLRLMARSLIAPDMRPRLAASDVVQETFLEALRDFPDFTGEGEPEVVAWLRKILVRNLADLIDHHHAGRRDVRRQQSIEKELEDSSQALHASLAASVSSPSAQAIRREEAVLLANALARLPAHYREVFILRNLESVPVAEIAVRMKRSPNGVRMLWGRAIKKLSQMMDEEP